jgi:hypothetical protein
VADKDAKPVSMDEIEAEDAVSLPNKEVMSLLDVNANVDLGLDLAAPVDLAAAANLNVAAPIEASAAANVLSPDAKAIGYASQSGSIDQGMSGTTADATAPQHAVINQDATGGSEPTAGGATGGSTGDGSVTAGVGGTADATGGVTGAVDGATSGVTGAVDGATGGATSGVGGAVGGVVDGAGGAVGGATGAAGGATGGVESLLSGGNLLDANVNIDAQANLTAPIDGAVAANANVAAPIDAAVAANVGSEGATAEALAPQQVNISQHLDDVSATAHAEQDAEVDQK